MLAEKNNSKTRNIFQDSLVRLYHFLVRQLTNTESLGAYLEPIIQQFKPSWRNALISAKVIENRIENANIFSLKLIPGKQWKAFKAGQFVQLTVNKNGALVSRTFSLASSPKQYNQNGQVTLTIRVQDSGAVTPWLKDNIKPDDTVYLSQASGDFTLQDNQRQKIFIAGGSGLTPIHSILSQSMNSSWFSNTHLLFYTQDQESLFYLQELNTLKQHGLQLHQYFSLTHGNFSRNHIEALGIDLQQADFYICGPQGMIDLCRSELKNLNVEEKHIHFEYFGAPAPSIDLDKLDLDKMSEESIYVDYLDSKKQVQYTPEHFGGNSPSTLLEAAEEEGLSPVSGCRMGVCHQCICKKKNGRVLNTKTGKISDTGEEEIQLCVSIPLSPVELEL